MNKTTKGALAASTAAVLLLGGAGSLAYWTDNDVVQPGSFASGEIKLTNGTCATSWTYAPGNAKAGSVVTAIVPGDKITKTCTFTVLAKGDNLSATPTLPAVIPVRKTSSDPGTSTLDATAAATYTTTSGFTAGKLTPSNNNDTLSAAITVSFPYGDATTKNANDTQNLIATVDALTVSLVQDNPNPA